MILDRLVIAGLSWAGHALLGSKVSPRSTGGRERAAVRDPIPETKRSATTVRSDFAPAETQEVYGPDQDLLQSLNARESMGFDGGMR